MKRAFRRRYMFVVAAMSLVFVAVAAAATYERFLAAGSYPPGTPASSSYSSSWINANSHTTQSANRTITLIDNVSYSWHGTAEGTSTDLWSSWNTTTVKKGYCLIHSSGAVACTVFDY